MNNLIGFDVNLFLGNLWKERFEKDRVTLSTDLKANLESHWMFFGKNFNVLIPFSLISSLIDLITGKECVP